MITIIASPIHYEFASCCRTHAIVCRLDEEQSAKLTIRGILSQNGKISEVVTATTPHSTSDAKSSVSSRKTLVSLIDKETKRAREDAMIKAVISAFRSGLLTIVEDEMEVLTNWSKAKLRWIKAIRKVLYKRQVQQLRLILSVKYPNLSINEIYNPIKTAESIPSGGVINDTDEEPKICSARQILLEDIGQRVELPTLIENETTNSSFPMKKHHFHRKLKKAKSSKGLLKKSPPTDCTHLVDNSRNTSELTAILPSFCTVGELLDFTPRDCACSRNRVLARHRNDNQHENERTQANEHQHMYEQEHEHQNDYQRAGFLSLTTNTSFSNFDDETHTTEACSNMSSTVSINTSANNRIVLPKLIIRHD